MCGIAGFSGKFEPDLLERMSTAIAHRGPDGNGVVHDRDAGIGLAHRRLAIIDLSPAGHHPMTDTNHRAVIVFNGEIYNFRELREGLVNKGYRFRDMGYCIASTVRRQRRLGRQTSLLYRDTA